MRGEDGRFAAPVLRDCDSGFVTPFRSNGHLLVVTNYTTFFDVILLPPYGTCLPQNSVDQKNVKTTHPFQVCQDWKFVALMVDRFLMYVFTGITIGSSIEIMLNVDSDFFQPFDQTARKDELLYRYGFKP